MANTFNLAKPINVREAVANIDYLYGPYTSVEEACQAIVMGRRKRGLTVGIQTESTFKEYQWKLGIEDEDLVEKIEKERSVLSYVPEYPEGETIHIQPNEDLILGFKFESPNYGQCQITISQNGDPVKVFKTDKGPITVNLGKIAVEGTYEFTVKGIDSLSQPADETLKFRVVNGGVKISSDFDQTLQQGINTSTDLRVIFNASAADITKTIRVIGKLEKDEDGEMTTIVSHGWSGSNPSYSISGGIWNIGPLTDYGWGRYRLTFWGYTGANPEDTSDDNVSSKIEYNFFLLDNNDFVLSSEKEGTDVSTNTNNVVSLPFIIESGGLQQTLKANGELYHAVSDGEGGWVVDGDPVTGYTLERNVAVNITNYWNMGKIRTNGDYLAKMWATTVGGQPAPQLHDPVWIHIFVDQYHSEYNVVADGLIAQFTADGKSNDNNTYTSGIWPNDIIGNNIYFELHGLNYNTNGWKHVDPSIPEDQPGETMLSFTGESYGILKNSTDNYNPMSDIRSYETGFTTEIIFRTRCIGELNTKVMTCHYGTGTNSAGYSASYDAVTIGSDGGTVKYDVAEDNWIHATLVVDKQAHENVVDAQDYTPFPLMTVYINGSMCTSVILTNEMTFNNIQNMVLLNAAYDTANSKIDYFGQCEIKTIRFYNKALRSSEVVQNYVASIYGKENQDRIDGRNGDVLPIVKFININDEEPRTAKEVEDNIELVNFATLNTISVKKEQKSRYVHAYIRYEEPEQTPIEWDHCIVQTQGTSSLAYPVKNYKIILYKDNTYNKKNKTDAFSYMGWDKESKFTLKCDYMEAAHLNNTPSCIFYNDMIDDMISSDLSISGKIATGWTGEPFAEGSTYDWTKDKRTPARREDLVGDGVTKTHFDAIKGFPCVVRYYESRTDYDNNNYTEVGTYMFNLDKSAASLGFEDDARKREDGITAIPIDNPRADVSLYETYNPAKTYKEGARVAYNDVAYTALESGITGEWDAEKWDAIPTTLGNIMQSFEGVANKSNSAGCFYSFDDYKDAAYHDDYCGAAYKTFQEQHPSSPLSLDEFISTYAGSATPYAQDGQGNDLFLMTKSDYLDSDQFPFKDKTEYDYFAADYEMRYDWDDYEEGGEEFWGNDNWGLKRVIDWVSDASSDINRFQTEFPQYFDLEYCILYYLQMIVFGQVDNAGKNAMWDTWDGLVWRPRPYDLDTAIGLDNSGFEAIDVDAELIRELSPFEKSGTLDGGTAGDYSEDVSDVANHRYTAYNTRTSKFWIAFAKAFKSEIASRYGELRQSGIYSIEYICNKYFANTSDVIGETYYNRDMTTKFYKLVDPAHRADYITRLHGNRAQKFKSWMTKRIIFCDTLFNYYHNESSVYKDSLNGTIVMRSDASSGSSRVNVYISMETYSPEYIRVVTGSTESILEAYCSPDSEYEDPNRPGVKQKGLLFKIPISSGNKEIQISGAGNIRVFGNLQGLKASSLTLGAAVKLTNLDLSGSEKLTTLSLDNNKYLQTINCSDAIRLGTDASGAQLNLSNCVNLKELNVNRTKLTSIAFPEGGSLKKVYAQNTTITGIILRSCQFLDTIDVTGCENIRIYDVDNCPSLTSIVVDNLPITTFEITNCENITSVSLAGCHSLNTYNIANCPNISTLSFQNNRSSSIVTLNLAAISGLHNLDVSGSAVQNLILPDSTDENFKTLALNNSDITNISYDILVENGADMSKLTGLTSLSFKSCGKLVSVTNLSYRGSCYQLFSGCRLLESVVGTIETTESAAEMFDDCRKLNSITNTEFIFSACTSLSTAFRYCYAIPLAQIKYVLDSCGDSLGNINNLCYGKGSTSYTGDAYTKMPANFFGNLKNVTSASSAFYSGGLKTLPANAFVDSNNQNGLAKLQTASLMFMNNSGITTIPTNILSYMPKLTGCGAMFSSCSGITTELPSNFFSYTPDITTTNSMFYGCSKLVVNIGSMADLLKPLTKLTNCGFMFHGCTKVTGIVPEGFLAINMSSPKLTNATCLFRNTGITGLPASGSLLRESTDTTSEHSLVNAGGMFNGCTGLTGVIPNSLLAGGTKITTIGNQSIARSSASGNVSTGGMFEGCTNIVGFGEDFFNQMKNQDGNNLSNLSNTFKGCSKLTGARDSSSNIVFPASMLNTHTGITTVSGMFQDCALLRITSMPNLFAGSKSKITNASNLFNGCSSIESFNNDLLSNMPRLTTCEATFKGCSSMYVDASSLDILNGDTILTNTKEMFRGCASLKNRLPATLFDSCRDTITNTSYMFYGCADENTGEGLSGIDAGNEDTTGTQKGLLADCLALTDVSYMFAYNRYLTGRIPWDIFWTSAVDKEYSVLENCSYLFYNTGFNQPTNVDDVDYMFHPNLFEKTKYITNMSFIFGRNNAYMNYSPNWSTRYPVSQNAFDNLYNLTTIRGMFTRCAGIGGMVSGRWFSNSVNSITDGREVFARTGITSVASDFLRLSGDSVNTKLTYVSKMFYGCTQLPAGSAGSPNLPPMNNPAIFSRIDQSSDAGRLAFCWNVSSPTSSYGAFGDPWNRYEQY